MATKYSPEYFASLGLPDDYKIMFGSDWDHDYMWNREINFRAYLYQYKEKLSRFRKRPLGKSWVRINTVYLGLLHSDDRLLDRTVETWIYEIQRMKRISA